MCNQFLVVCFNKIYMRIQYIFVALATVKLKVKVVIFINIVAKCLIESGLQSNLPNKVMSIWLV